MYWRLVDMRRVGLRVEIRLHPSRLVGCGRWRARSLLLLLVLVLLLVTRCGTVAESQSSGRVLQCLLALLTHLPCSLLSLFLGGKQHLSEIVDPSLAGLCCKTQSDKKGCDSHACECIGKKQVAGLVGRDVSNPEPLNH